MAVSASGLTDREWIGIGEPVAPVSVVPVVDPEALVRTCLNCGATMTERACKLVCACGYFASCSDYY
jgi:hypothetical protein